jgi:hypothetical protein
MIDDQLNQPSLANAYPHADFNWGVTSQLRQLDPDFVYIDDNSIENSLDKEKDYRVLLHKTLELLIHDDANVLMYTAALLDTDDDLEYDPKIGLRNLDTLKLRLRLEIYILQFIERKYQRRVFFLNDLQEMFERLSGYDKNDRETFIEATQEWEKMKNHIKAQVITALGRGLPRFYEDLESWDNLFT